MTSRLPDLVGARRDGSVSLAGATIIAVLRAIQLGWRAAVDVAEGDAAVLSQELPMTHRLCAAMGRVVDSSQDQYPMRITPGTVVIPSEDAPRLVGLTDISIYLNGLPGHDPHAIIECKRVHGGDRKLCRLYASPGNPRAGPVRYLASDGHEWHPGTHSDCRSPTIRRDDYLTPSRLICDCWVQGEHSRQIRSSPCGAPRGFLIVAKDQPRPESHDGQPGGDQISADHPARARGPTGRKRRGRPTGQQTTGPTRTVA